jgi:hypothetical protein
VQQAFLMLAMDAVKLARLRPSKAEQETIFYGTDSAAGQLQRASLDEAPLSRFISFRAD